MFEFLLRAYLNKKVTRAQVEYAATKGWITVEQRDQILNATSLDEFDLPYDGTEEI